VDDYGNRILGVGATRTGYLIAAIGIGIGSEVSRRVISPQEKSNMD
jgi:hypothetical protein